MKRVLVAVLLAALGLSGCYWSSNAGVGGVQLELSGIAPKGPGDYYARVWLVANDALYPLGGGADYVQKLIPGWEVVTVTLEGIPVGPEYRIWLSVVQQQGAGWYRTEYWAESAPFELFPGARAAVVFSNEQLGSSWDDKFHPVTDYLDADTLMGRSLVDVLDYSGTLYAAEPGAVHEVSFNFTPYSEMLSLYSVPAPEADTINSISAALGDWGVQQLAANTGRGIFPYNGEGFDPPATVKLGSLSVLDSASTEHFAGNKALYFRRAAGWGGTYAGVETRPEEWRWANHDSGAVWDLAVQPNEGGAFFATSEGAFFVDSLYLYQLAYGEDSGLSDYTQTIRAPHRILCLDYWEYEGDALYMGTEDGVWSAWTPGNLSIIDPPQLVPGTEGHRFRKVAVLDWSYMPVLGAFLSDAYLFVVDRDGMHTYPLAAGLPSRIRAIAWYELAGPMPRYFLMVAGDSGLVYKEFFQ